MIPINVSEERLRILAGTFGCSIGSLPFIYLGLPLCIARPRALDFMPMVSKCEKRLAVISPFLNQAGRLQMVNAVFSALPTFFMCSIVLPKSIIKQIDKCRKHCLWRGPSINARGPPKAAWEMVCVPKEEGGMGVIDLERQNKALLMKNLHKFFNKHDLPWVQLVWEKHYSNGKLPNQTRKGSFWWRDILKLLPQFKEIAKPLVKNGVSIFFWLDEWNIEPLSSMAPELFSFAKNKQISVQKVVNLQELTELFQLPLPQLAFNQMQDIQTLMGSLVINDASDKWTYSGGSENFASSKVYKALIGHSDIHPAYKWLWKNRAQPKHRVFFWLLIKDRLSTKNILRRKNMALDSYHCALCNQLTEETAYHLFVDCAFAKMCWDIIGIDISSDTPFPELVSLMRVQLNSSFFMEAVILMCWTIWTARNDLIFRGEGRNRADWSRIFFKELNLLQHRLKPGQEQQFNSWIQSLVLLAA